MGKIGPTWLYSLNKLHKNEIFKGLLKVAGLERKLTEAAILHVSSNDPVNAREEQERNCEVLKRELQEAKKVKWL